MNLVCSVRELESEKYLPFWSVILKCSFNLTFLIDPRQIVLKCSFNLTFLIDLRQIFLECSLNLTFLIDLWQIMYWIEIKINWSHFQKVKGLKIQKSSPKNVVPIIKYVMKQKILLFTYITWKSKLCNFCRLKNWNNDKRLNPRSNFDQCTGVIYHCFVWLIYYSHCTKSTGQKSCESHLCAVVKDIF